MYTILQESDFELRPGGTVRIEGALHGSGASFFHVRDQPGGGPPLHVHPYPETWLVLAGTVRFTVGGEDVETGAGAVVVGPENIPHKFVNIGEGVLEMVCIHPAPQIIQTDLDE